MVPPAAGPDKQGPGLEELLLTRNPKDPILRKYAGPDFQVQGGDFHGPPGDPESRSEESRSWREMVDTVFLLGARTGFADFRMWSWRS